MKEYTSSIAKTVMTKSRNDFIVYDIISSKEFVGEGIHKLNCEDSDDQESE